MVASFLCTAAGGKKEWLKPCPRLYSVRAFNLKTLKTSFMSLKNSENRYKEEERTVCSRAVFNEEEAEEEPQTSSNSNNDVKAAPRSKKL